jgi:hypothetical protein
MRRGRYPDPADLGIATHLCDESSFLLSTIDLPVISQVVADTPPKPMLADGLDATSAAFEVGCESARPCATSKR